MLYWWLPHKAALARCDEGEQMLDARGGEQLGTDGFGGLGDIEIGAAEEAVGFAEFFDFFGRETAAFETSDIYGAQRRWVGIGNHIGGDILDNFAAPADHRVCAETAELMHCGETAEYDEVLDFDMTCDGSIIGKNHMVSDSAIVGDVSIGEEGAVVADESF